MKKETTPEEYLEKNHDRTDKRGLPGSQDA